MCKDKKRARETQQLHHKRTASYQIMQETNEIILYQPNQSIKLEVRLEDETVWLTQAQLSELFQRERTVITKHINNIFKEKELEEKSNVHFLHIAHSDKPIKYYSLDVIISVGYRVKSQRGVEFRQWANKVLKGNHLANAVQTEPRSKSHNLYRKDRQTPAIGYETPQRRIFTHRTG